MTTHNGRAPLSSVPDGQLEMLTQLPSQLSQTSEVPGRNLELFKIAARHLVQVFPTVKYVRIALMSDALQATDVWDLCQDKSILRSMGQLAHSTRTSQFMALQQQQLLTTAVLGHDIYDDWRVLSNVHGMRSMAAAPLSVSTKAYGVLLLASDDPQCINKANVAVVETAASMLAPYAAMLHKHQQLQATHHVLGLLLPPNVVSAVQERVGWGNNTLELQH